MRMVALSLVMLACGDKREGTRIVVELDGTPTTRQLAHFEEAMRERYDDKGLDGFTVTRTGKRITLELPTKDPEIVAVSRELATKSVLTELRWRERGETIAGRDVIDAKLTYDGTVATPIVHVTLATPATMGGPLEIHVNGRLRETGVARPAPDGIVLTLDGPETEVRSMEIALALRLGALPPIKLVE